jgi:2-dehydro-3-deoxygluconokinase
VFGGAEELVLMFPDTDAAGAASALLEGGARQVVLKDGAAGATLFDGGEPVVAPGFVIDVVDTVGAGDAFVAGYLDGMLRGLAPAEGLRQANACGAIACLTPGDWEAAPTRRDLERFLDGGAGDPVIR